MSVFNLVPQNENTKLFQIKSDTPISKEHRKHLENLHITEDWLRDRLNPIINQRSSISIRMMDWLCTNYSKKYKNKGPEKGEKGVYWTYTSPKNEERAFILFEEYNMELSGKTRKLFDPFRRGNRIMIEITTHDNETVLYSTTIAQVTFWDWADKHGVYQYAYDNSEKIDSDMNKAHHERDIKRGKTGKRKRAALSTNPYKGCASMFNGGTLVFDSSSDEESEESDEEIDEEKEQKVE